MVETLKAEEFVLDMEKFTRFGFHQLSCGISRSKNQLHCQPFLMFQRQAVLASAIL
jgi:hypothetical protein